MPGYGKVHTEMIAMVILCLKREKCPVLDENSLGHVIRCAIWYNLYNFENMKNSHGGVLRFEPAILLRVTLLHGCFSRFLNC